MTRKSPSAPLPTPKIVQQLRQGIDRIQRRISELETFQPESVKERWAPETKALEAAIADTIDAVFGHNSSRGRRFSAAANLDRGALILGGGSDPLYKIHQWLTEGKADALALLREAVRSLEEDLVEIEEEAVTPPQPRQNAAISNDEIFIVHGRDTPAKHEVELLIERAGLKPIVLHRQPNEGRTIIEKFEAHGGAAGFAVVVLTPDDVGGLDPDNLRPRARQNVIGELFWFAGRLGRKRVCALKKGDIEMPSDFAGIGYTDMDDRGAWKAELLRELQTAGYSNLDWGKALA
ncbi:nucleotide-binding protein [Bradyrhizobium sp. CB82]|uniref:nucleotide-binding protein n=1 Tax=Bradyrhizobium sp. CB82 TaxID=3039159 RepID=UPI0024B17757|nr:nucleotide-binding protein [Bradyrhizobium sp. CB82]WFU39871.1 nucleotide-binding protein [Bradyrhizobium sp. CB82]